ncbi:MAG: hypothetical protein MJE66_04575 [Proteobacteria bacterium]|nr:hypothetical protein [Pseudomonadota bacterium]
MRKSLCCLVALAALGWLPAEARAEVVQGKRVQTNVVDRELERALVRTLTPYHKLYEPLRATPQTKRPRKFYLVRYNQPLQVSGRDMELRMRMPLKTEGVRVKLELRF